MDNIKLVFFGFLLLLISNASLATTTLPALRTYRVTAGGVSYTDVSQSFACSAVFSAPFYGVVSGNICYKKSADDPNYSSSYSITTTAYTCSVYSSATLSGSSCLVPDCSGGYTLTGSYHDVPIYECVADPVCSATEQLIDHQCVADPVCSSTEQLINHQCVADPTCSATEQLINHQCVADPVCSSTEQLINHQCVADPTCSATEQLINHQCVADPTCSATEQLINHQCVADPTCSATEQLINHQCVADPTCSATEQLINHQCVANQNTDTNSDFKFQTNATTVYYTQTVVGTKLVTKLGTSSGAALATQANDTPLTPYVGLYVDPADGAVYYSYKAVLDVGSGETIPISLKRRISYDSIADMIVHYQMNSAMFTAQNNPFQWLSDFFIRPAEAFWVQLYQIASALFTAYGIYEIGKHFFKKPPEGAMTGECRSGAPGIYDSPNAVCVSLYPDQSATAIMTGAAQFVCKVDDGTTRIGGSCSSLSSPPDEPTSPGDIGRQIAIDFKDRTLLGKINNILNAMATMVDIVKAIHDAYQHFSHEKPSPKKPTGDAEMPSSPAGHKPEFGKDPVDLKKPKGDTKTDPVDLTKDKGSSVQTKPDGSQTKEDQQIKVKTDPEWPDEVTAEIEVTVETFSPDGSSSGQTFERRSPESSYEPDSPGGNDPPPVDLCAKDPTIIACSHWGKPEPPDEIKTHEMDISLDPGGSSSGSCPADKQAHTRYGVIPISFAPVCQAAGYIKFILVSLAWLAAGFILFGTVKD